MNRILFAIALLALTAAPALAQKTKAQLTTEIGTTYPDNTAGSITPSGVRAYETDVINSIMPTAPVVSGNLACFSGTTGLLQDCGIAPSTLIIGTTNIQSGTSGRMLYDNAGKVSELSIPSDNFAGGGASGTIQAVPMLNCLNALTYNTSTHVFGCNTLAGTGTVTGPVSSTDFDVALFNGTSGTALRDALAGFGLMPGGLKVTNTTDISTLSGLQGSTQISGGLSIAKQTLSLASGEPAFQVASCGINAMTQNAQPSNTQENLMFYDCTDTLSIGPNNDNGRTVIQYNAPRQLFKYDEKISFCQSSLDARLTANALGAGSTQGFSAPCRMTIAPNTGSTSNGTMYPMNNFQLNMPARTNIYFILDATDNRNQDIRFGITQLSGGDISGSGCYFMSLQNGTTANMRTVCTDGVTTVNSDSGVNNIQTRRIYMLQIVKGTPTAGNPKVNFWCGDSNNVLQACGSINVGTSGLPSDVVNLVPFFRVKENNTTFAYTVNMNEVYVITEQ